MTAHQKEIEKLTNEGLLGRMEGNIINQISESINFLRVTKPTLKRYEDIKAEILKRMKK